MSRDYVLQPFRPPVEFHIDYAAELNPQQLAAVTATPGPALVIAGAGAGKTRTLIYRVAFLLEQGVPPENILLLTFTNKAAKEMMRRVADLVPIDLGGLWGGTFHAVGNRVLRRHAAMAGFPRDFTILDRDDAVSLLDACLKEESAAEPSVTLPKAEPLAEAISLAANTRRPLSKLLDERMQLAPAIIPKIEEIAQRYAARKRASSVMDFDDLLCLWFQLLKDQPEVLEYYQRRFHFILVDEYQDTNQLQSDLIELLAARHDNLMVVGDDAQSIYAWRGAHLKNILGFPQRHRDARVFKIETNYRSTPEILALANAAIARNVGQHPKELAPVRKSGAKPALVACSDARVQAAFVVRRALDLHEGGLSFNHIAVLYRSHFHALELQLELSRQRVPFRITSGIRFFEQAHVKDLSSYLKLAANPRDETAFKRLAKMLPGVGLKMADKLWRNFAAQPALVGPAPPSLEPAPEGIPNPPSSPTPRPSVAGALGAIALNVPKKAVAPWGQFVATMKDIEAQSPAGDPAAMINLIREAVYEDYLKSTYDNANARLEDIEQLAVFAHSFPSLSEFLTQLALLTNMEAEGDRESRDAEERINLTTIHQAKGLEFPVVFVIMLGDGMFPTERSTLTSGGEEEERRLFYVAVTRAKDELYLTYPSMRSMGNEGSPAFFRRSRFLNDLPPDCYEEWNLQSPDPYGSPGSTDQGHTW